MQSVISESGLHRMWKLILAPKNTVKAGPSQSEK